MQQKNADMLYGAVLAGMACAMFAHTFSPIYQNEFLFGDVSTVFFPRVLLGIIFVLSMMLVVKGKLSTSDAILTQINVKRVLLTGGATLITVVGVWYLGYLVMMPVGVFLIGLALGYPNLVILGITSLISPLVVWVILAKFAQVSFAPGTLL